MKKLRDFASVRVNAAEIRAFVKITFRASESQIVWIVRTAVLAGDNVFNVKA